MNRPSGGPHDPSTLFSILLSPDRHVRGSRSAVVEGDGSSSGIDAGCDELIGRWRRGERPLAEGFLGRLPGLDPRGDGAFDDLLGRFPEQGGRLRRQVFLHRSFGEPVSPDDEALLTDARGRLGWPALLRDGIRRRRQPRLAARRRPVARSRRGAAARGPRQGDPPGAPARDRPPRPQARQRPAHPRGRRPRSPTSAWPSCWATTRA